jgi:tRNA(Ile)-lysidine synthase
VPLIAAAGPTTTAAVSDAEFAALMARLGPFEPAPHLAAAVSGGADSLCLGLLADRWARTRGGRITALVVDHGLRLVSAAEAAQTCAWLGQLGIATRLLTLTCLAHGTGLSERAREARYAALESACREMGIVHLLLGHHAADQAETVLMRKLAASGPAGLAGMAALRETRWVRLLRPLLPVAPVRLRATLREAGVSWVEDPSNADPTWLRGRLRSLRRDADGIGPATRALVQVAAMHGIARAEADHAHAAVLADRVRFYSEGFAVLTPGPMPRDAFARVVAMIAGALRPPAADQSEALAASLRPATLGGVRLLQADRLGPGFLVVREEAAMAPAVPARPGASWDGRFRLTDAAIPPSGAMLGALGADASRVRRRARLPAAVLRTLPCVRVNTALFAVPHLGYPDPVLCARVALTSAVALPACGAPWVGSAGGEG